MSSDRDEELRSTPLHKADPTTWPKGVRQIAIGEMDLLGVDRNGVLYWDGHPVVVRKGVTLSFWQGLATLLIVIFTAIGGIGAATQGWVAAHQWSCQIKWTSWKCPLPPPPPPAPPIQTPLFLQRGELN